MKKTVLKNVIILVLMPVLGLFLMLLVHLLPVEGMKDNVMTSIDSLTKEFTDELAIDGYNASMIGNFTDSLMTEFAIYDSPHPVFEQVMFMYRKESCPDGGWWPGVSLTDYLYGNPQPVEVEYSRYWHGYLIVLKPLFLFCSLNSVRLFNSIFQIILLSAALIGLSKNGHTKVALALAASMPFMYFFSSFASLSLSICIYILLAEMILIGFFNDKFKSGYGYVTFFMIAGAAVAFFDFLTYPLVTLAIPLCAVLCMNGEEKLKKGFLNILINSLSWGVGYIYMWASKWVLALIFTGNNTVKDAIATVSLRTSNAPGAGRIKGYVTCLKSNLSPFANRAFACLFICILIYIAVNLILELKMKNSLSVNKAVPAIVIGIIPFAWWFVTLNHSSEHWMFTCRIFAVSIFSLICAFSAFTKKREEEKSV
ncbi:MAG: hypothetical protein J5840_09025 [Lachnospiraceae bacterium]|nr:hypothetical protein [Lachnospiraceae bacterium]